MLRLSWWSAACVSRRGAQGAIHDRAAPLSFRTTFGSSGLKFSCKLPYPLFRPTLLASATYTLNLPPKEKGGRSGGVIGEAEEARGGGRGRGGGAGGGGPGGRPPPRGRGLRGETPA